MLNRQTIPEITCTELSSKLKSKADFVLLDIRELWEVERARISDPRLVILPMSRLSSQPQITLAENLADKTEQDVIVYCHHGTRSATVTAWLISQGWQKSRSLRGGIEEFASQIDPSVGKY